MRWVTIPGIDHLYPDDCDTRQIRGGIRDILQSHISRWIVEVVKSAYLTHDQVPPERVTAHELRALSSSWAYNCHIALEAGWETSTRPLANASENLAGLVEFCVGYIRDYPVRASAKKF